MSKVYVPLVRISGYEKAPSALTLGALFCLTKKAELRCYNSAIVGKFTA